MNFIVAQTHATNGMRMAGHASVHHPLLGINIVWAMAKSYNSQQIVGVLRVFRWQKMKLSKAWISWLWKDTSFIGPAKP